MYATAILLTKPKKIGFTTMSSYKRIQTKKKVAIQISAFTSDKNNTVVADDLVGVGVVLVVVFGVVTTGGSIAVVGVG